MKRVFFGGVSILALAYAPVSFAQTTNVANVDASANRPDTQSNGGIAEIVVTAQRRAQSAQDVPISVSAFNSKQMEKVGLTTTADLPAVVPGVVIFPTGTRSPLYIRGVGNNSVSTSPSVLTFVDGVYQPFDNTGLDFANVQSVEVAKGPQGTLFGRNATGGVLQITTKNPLDWQGVDAQIGYANYDTYMAKLYGAAKLADRIALDVSGFYDNQRDGWGKNLADGSDTFTSKRYGIRSKLVAELGDGFTATLVGDYASRQGQLGVTQGPGTSKILYNSVTQTAFTIANPYDILADVTPSITSKEGGVALTLEKRIGDVKLMSITSWRRIHEVAQIDFDGNDTRLPFGPGPQTYTIFSIGQDFRRTAITQELQASGSTPGLEWATGLYYFHMKTNGFTPFGGFGPFVAFQTASPADSVNVYGHETTNAYAAYGQATVKLTPSTRLTLGARYTVEIHELEGYSTGSALLSPTSAGKQDVTFTKPNFRVALDQKITPDILAYASWSRAFNSGFFNQIPLGGFNDAANPVVRPEILDAYEVGFKSDLLDRHLRVNAAAFLYDYSNLQQQIFSFGSIQTLNAASARIKGIDLEIIAKPVANLLISASGTYLDSKYLSYPLAPNYTRLSTGELAILGTQDAAGNQLVNAPELGVQGTITYTIRTAIGTFDSTANLTYQSKYYSDAQNRFPVPERMLVGLNEQWTSKDGATTVTAWVKNLTNKKYETSYSLNSPVGLAANPGAPRTYGLTVGHKF